MLRKIPLYVFACSLYTMSYIQALTVQHDLSAESAILINAKTGKVLYEKKPNKLSYPASTTKIATALFALSCRPNSFQELVTVQKEVLRCVSNSEKRQQNWNKYPSYVLQSDGSSAGLKPNEVLTFKDLLYGVMLESGNDSSNVVAHYVGNGSIPAFMEGVNNFLRKLGCQNTSFNNPHGLHNPEHVTTAKDMAIIAQYALQNKVLKDIVKTVTYEKQATNLQPKVTYIQSNKLLRKGPYYYEYAIGVKTGYTTCAGNTLVAAAEKDDRTLIAVLFHCKSRGDSFKEAKALFESAYKEKKIEKSFLGAGIQAFNLELDGAKSPISTFTLRPLIATYYPSEIPQLKCELTWDQLQLPVEAGSKVGVLRLIDNGKVYSEVELYAKERVEETFMTSCKRVIKNACNKAIDLWPLVAACAIGIVVYSYSRFRKKQRRSSDSRRL